MGGIRGSTLRSWRQCFLRASRESSIALSTMVKYWSSDTCRRHDEQALSRLMAIDAILEQTGPVAKKQYDEPRLMSERYIWLGRPKDPKRSVTKNRLVSPHFLVHSSIVRFKQAAFARSTNERPTQASAVTYTKPLLSFGVHASYSEFLPANNNGGGEEHLKMAIFPIYLDLVCDQAKRA